MSIFNFFKKSNVKFLGRTGLSFHDEGNEYYISTNDYFDENGEIKIYYKEIRLTRSDISISEADKKKIAVAVVSELEKRGRTATIVPELPINL